MMIRHLTASLTVGSGVSLSVGAGEIGAGVGLSVGGRYDKES